MTSPLPRVGSLDWVRAIDHPELLAAPTLAALTRWITADPRVADEVSVAEIDPSLADTAALTAAYGLPPAASVNCVLIGGRRAGDERRAAAVVRATTRADVNNVIRRLLDVRKASFLATEQATEASGMEYGGITPLGLPADWRVLVDSRVVGSRVVGSRVVGSRGGDAGVGDSAVGDSAVGDSDAGVVIIGSGLRRSKLALAGALLARLPGAEVIDGLAVG
ncbi:YbaK/EbsC family protein [Pengzhenrongella sicca]|uniref:YbaK/aminoacyl-tRNA synthetase-associated domain-containing protein n=1 Tax=Pengzhenrongella sicca TaxID=2819238 RepID=A0A8A4ZIF0_9MICO|nr:YbaK/EbsC family protein [Pengzhenrongella sicca]QTE30749.1 hypothetical protein J4E96_07345 [Pengzhenrongella sicca]